MVDKTYEQAQHPALAFFEALGTPDGLAAAHTILGLLGSIAGGGGGGGPVTVADGADVALGATTAAENLPGAPGPVTGGLRLLTRLAQETRDFNSTMAAQGAVTTPVETVGTAGEAHLGSVGGATPRITASLGKPASATQYTIGDIIANSLTAGSVVPITFSGAGRISGGSGRLTGARCVLTAASGTIVLPKFDLLLFRPAPNIPIAAGSYPADNGVLNVSAAAMKELVAIFSFLDTGWRNQLGDATAAGDHVYQAVTLASGRAFAPFNLASISSSDLVGVLQDRGAWNPGNVAQTFDFVLDTDQD